MCPAPGPQHPRRRRKAGPRTWPRPRGSAPAPGDGRPAGGWGPGLGRNLPSIREGLVCPPVRGPALEAGARAGRGSECGGRTCWARSRPRPPPRPAPRCPGADLRLRLRPLVLRPGCRGCQDPAAGRVRLLAVEGTRRSWWARPGAGGPAAEGAGLGCIGRYSWTERVNVSGDLSGARALGELAVPPARAPGGGRLAPRVGDGAPPASAPRATVGGVVFFRFRWALVSTSCPLHGAQ